MNKIIILYTILLFVLHGCSKDEGVRESCVNTKLEEMGMIPYKGQEIGCIFFLELYVFKKKEYFVLGNHCADIIALPVDCEGNNL